MTMKPSGWAPYVAARSPPSSISTRYVEIYHHPDNDSAKTSCCFTRRSHLIRALDATDLGTALLEVRDRRDALHRRREPLGAHREIRGIREEPLTLRGIREHDREHAIDRLGRLALEHLGDDEVVTEMAAVAMQDRGHALAIAAIAIGIGDVEAAQRPASLALSDHDRSLRRRRGPCR